MKNKALPTLKDVRTAHKRIAEYIHRTPVLTSRQIDEQAGANLYFKCENFQRVGAFKFRGASNAIFSLTDEEARNGVATHSSGNHAQAVALAAKLRNIPSHIAMPENAPRVKVDAVKNYGAKVTFCEATQEARESTLAEIVKQTGATFIHPYNDPNIIAGQGTAALELLGNHPDLDLVIVPVGGGGLISGTAITISATSPRIKTVGSEPEIANDAYLSFKTGKRHPVQSTNTVADGLRTSLGDLTFACIREHVDDIVTVSEQQIIEAMRLVWERMNIIIEPSSAVPVAAVLNQKVDTAGKKTGIIISGGNMDLDHLPWMEDARPRH